MKTAEEMFAAIGYKKLEHSFMLPNQTKIFLDGFWKDPDSLFVRKLDRHGLALPLTYDEVLAAAQLLKEEGYGHETR